MPLEIDWRQIAGRLFLTILAGALIGWNRGETGHPAGLRTTLLVCLAASVAMIEANLLLDTRNKPPDSFAGLDVARFPLGILSGMGFIGAGAIIHRGSLVEGVTTAATLWFVTMIGLCFGGGLLGVGLAATAIGFLTLTALKRLEDYLPMERRATVDLTVEGDSLALAELSDGLASRGYRIVERAVLLHREPAQRRVRCEVTWRAAAIRPEPTEWLDRLATQPGVVEVAWQLGPPTPDQAWGPLR